MPTDAADEITIKQVIAEAADVLRQAGVAEPRREAASILAYTLQRDRTFLLTHAETIVREAELPQFRENLRRRSNREPLQYITGLQEFYNLDFAVTPDVLIPRPETELLVETALELLHDVESPLILDLGSGSGCIIVSLLHELPAARGIASDISPAALVVAEANARRHGVRARLALLAADGFSALAGGAAKFSIIVSNPPYIDEHAIEELQPEVRLYEPLAALTPGADGARLIRELLREAPSRLGPGGWLVFEIGYDQSALVNELIDRRVWELVALHKDLQGIPRTVVVRLASG